MGGNKIKTRDVVVTIVGMTLGVVALASIALGAHEWHEQSDGHILLGNLGVALSCFGIVGLVGFYERDAAIWRYGRAWAFAAVGMLFMAAALGAPKATGWLFEIVVALT